MKAAIYNGKKNVEIKKLETPHAGDNDIVIKNIYSSICGTDVAVYFYGANTGHKVDVGGEFGHETISQVVEVGKNVKDIKVGDIVYPYPREAKDDPHRAGTLGGFSEYILVPNCELGRSVYKLKKGISIREACLIEPFTVGTRAARRSFPKKDEKAIVFGAGTIGIASAIALKYFGCSQVMMVDLSDFRLDIVRKLGFETCNSNKENLTEKATEYFGKAYNTKGETADVDIYIDAAGANSILDIFQDMGKIESRIVMVAVGNPKREVDILNMTYSHYSIIGSGGYFPIDVEDVMNIMASHKWNIESIITNEFRQEEITKAIEVAGDSQNALNVIIKY